MKLDQSQKWTLPLCSVIHYLYQMELVQFFKVGADKMRCIIDGWIERRPREPLYLLMASRLKLNGYSTNTKLTAF